MILILLFIFNYLYRLIKVYHHKEKVALLLYTFFFFLGALCTSTERDALNSKHFSKRKAKYLKIYIADEPLESHGLRRFKARVTAAGKDMKMSGSSGVLMISVRPKNKRYAALNYGGVYLIPARWTSIPPPLNPAEFDSQGWMANQHIYHQVFLSEDELIPLPEQRGSPLIRYTLALRKRQVQYYRKLIRDDEAFAVAATLILGYRSDLNTATLAAYSQTGTIHALSVSGMHVAMVYAVLELALQWMNRKTALKWIRMILILLLIWFYTLLTGCSASVLRSAIMLSLLILGKALHKDTGGFHILALSAFILLFTEPLLLWDVGFQLSYMAVAGLIYLHPKIFALCAFKGRLFREAWSIVSVSMAAQLFTLPFSIYYFHQFPVYFLLSNLFIALPVLILMYGGLVLLLSRMDWLAVPFEWLLTLMNRGLAWIAGLPYSTIHQIWISKLQLCLFCMAILLLMTGICHRKKQQLLWGLFLLILMQGMLLRDKLAAGQQLMIIVYSLNKNYAAAFIRSGTAVVLTDLRPGDQAFRFHIQPSLDQHQIRHISCIPWNTIAQPGKNHVQKDFQLKDHQLYFHHFKILLLDSFFNRRLITARPAFDAVWIHGSPSINASALRKRLRFKEIWIDATNQKRLIDQFESDTPEFKNSVHVFKKIKASLINLK